jgi:DNA anti-recombination protein RmuC
LRGRFSYNGDFRSTLAENPSHIQNKADNAALSEWENMYMVSLLNNINTSTNELGSEPINQTQRLSALEQELERLNRQLRQNQQYTAALEVDFEHLLNYLKDRQGN